MSKQTRLAIINHEKCKPKKCNHECRKGCPVNKQGKQCIEIEAVVTISEDMCIGCGMCVKACPFDAIQIANLPTELNKSLVYSYGENCFRLYKLPKPKMGKILGFIGQNGIGKSTLMKILSGVYKPNFGTNDPVTNGDIFNKVKGTELQKYFDLLYSGKLVVKSKPQNIDKMLNSIKKKSPTMTIRGLLSKYYDDKDDWHIKVFEQLSLTNIRDNTIATLSGGEFQRVVCASVLIQKANVYIFDEPTNYLDIKQRLNIANLIRELSNDGNYIFLVEHDLSVLDYISDFLCLMYGEPSAFGVISTPTITSRAINMFFDGYIPVDNVRFRKDSYTFKKNLRVDLDDNTIGGTNTKYVEYDSGYVDYDNFRLDFDSGQISESSVTVLLGQNGCGKTTFLDHLAKNLKASISYKPQYIDINKFKVNNDYPTVYNLYLKHIQKSISSNLFSSNVIKPLNLEKLYEKKINKLSGGELQRVMIGFCLGTNAEIYLIDEPSASLDIEQRVSVIKVIKRFLIHNKKMGFIVEHDMMMTMSLSTGCSSKIILFDKKRIDDKAHSSATSPMKFSTGINGFLTQLDVTFRTDKTSDRPRINKQGSTMDSTQKQLNKYYM